MLFVAGLVALAACSSDDGRTMRPPSPVQVESVATTVPGATTLPGEPLFPDNTDAGSFLVTGPWAEGSRIAAVHTCEAGNASPPVAFGNLPEGTVALGLVLYPTDRPDRILWALANIDAAAAYVPEATVPPGAVEATNSEGITGYSGPCPADSDSQSFTLVGFALGQIVDVLQGDPAVDALAAMQRAAIDIDTTQFRYSP